MAALEPRALLAGMAVADPLEAFPSDPNLPINNGAPSAGVLPLSSVPLLNSHSSSAVKVYLDFVGAPAQTWGTFHPTVTPAYDTDGDPTTFSNNELSQIREIHQRVAEKYSPFNVDVTTVDPGTYPYGSVVRVVIGGDGAWAGGTFGGYGYVYGFQGVTSNTAWVFSKNLGAGLPKYVAEAAAHESGHNFGLYHQSEYSALGVKLNEYLGGRDKANPDLVGPIMGFSYYAARGLWWDGKSSESYFSAQHDLETISASNFGYRPDDYGNDRFSSTLLALMEDEASVVGAAGVIERMTDVDCFKFHSTGGLVNLSVDVAPLGPMLDLKVRLTDELGNELFAADTASLGERVVALVPAGDYYLMVASHGGYGDVGQFSVSGTVVPEPATIGLVVVAGIAWLSRRRGRAGGHRWSTVAVASPF